MTWSLKVRKDNRQLTSAGQWGPGPDFRNWPKCEVPQRPRYGRDQMQSGLARTSPKGRTRHKSDVHAVRLGSSRVRVSVMGWCPIGFPIALDGGDFYLGIIPGRSAPKWDVRHIDSIVLTF